jgi:hypothetical protein
MWTAEFHHAERDGHIVYASLHDPKGRYVGDIHALDAEPGDEAIRERVAFILSCLNGPAPELLDALRLAFVSLQDPCGNAFRDMHPATWRQMQAAIARATA